MGIIGSPVLARKASHRTASPYKCPLSRRSGPQQAFWMEDKKTISLSRLEIARSSLWRHFSDGVNHNLRLVGRDLAALTIIGNV